MVIGENAKTARVIRAGRKLIGKGQAELAALLQVPQTQMADMEGGRLLPTALQWQLLCDAFGIDSEISYQMGIIDRCTDCHLDTSNATDAFSVSERYLGNRGSKVRTTRPFLKYFETQLGEQELKNYLDHVEMDADFFTVYDNQLNMGFTLDMSRAMILKGVLKKKDVSQLAAICGTVEVHGNLHSYYTQLKNAQKLLKSFLQNIGKYEVNFLYDILEEDDAGFALAITPTDHVHGFSYKDDVLGTFICDYKKQLIYQFIKKITGISVDIQEPECHFKGEWRCLYRITLTT